MNKATPGAYLISFYTTPDRSSMYRRLRHTIAIVLAVLLASLAVVCVVAHVRPLSCRIGGVIADCDDASVTVRTYPRWIFAYDGLALDALKWSRPRVRVLDLGLIDVRYERWGVRRFYRVSVSHAALLFGVTALWMGCFLAPRLRVYRRVRSGRCGRCGYDLRGIETGGCPECGSAMKRNEAGR